MHNASSHDSEAAARAASERKMTDELQSAVLASWIPTRATTTAYKR